MKSNLVPGLEQKYRLKFEVGRQYLSRPADSNFEMRKAKSTLMNSEVGEDSGRFAALTFSRVLLGNALIPCEVDRDAWKERPGATLPTPPA
jgi:hypothetical protein